MQVLYSVTGNTAPNIIVTLTRLNGDPIDVTNCTVKLILVKTHGKLITNDEHQECTLTTPTEGVVTYDLQAGDLPYMGTYRADIEITYPTEEVEVLYEQVKLRVRARGDVDATIAD